MVAQWWPSVEVGVAFGTDYRNGTPSFTDLTSYALAAEGFTISRKRSRALDRVETGTFGFALLNSSGTFNPRNTASAYYPIELSLPVRCRAVYNSTTYNLYRGFTEGWTPVPDKERPRVDVTCADAGKLFNRDSNLTASYASELSSVRVTNVLNTLSWPAGLRSIETGLTTLQASNLTDANALEHLRKVVDTELGVLYQAPNGNIVFQNRHHRSTDPNNAIQATFGGVGGLPYSSLVVPYNDQNIRNYISCQRTGGTAQVASDATSINQHGRRSLSRTDLLSSTDAEMANQASWILFRDKDGEPEIDSIILKGRDDAALWAQILGRDVGDHVRVIRQQPGDDIDMEVIIESVSHTIRDKGLDWTTTWRCSPARFWAFWLLGYHKLGLTTVLGY